VGTTTIYPDNVYSETGAKTLTGGATIQAVEASGDADYVQAAAASYHAVLAFPTPTLPAGAKIDKVKCQLRALRSSSEVWALTNLGVYVPSSGTFRYAQNSFLFTSQALDGVIRENDSAYYTGLMDGGTWNAADADGSDLSVELFLYNPSGSNARAHAVRLVVSYDEIPVVSAITPTGTVTVSRPTIGWAFADPEGASQQKYRVKIFDAATYGAGGFNADTSTPAWDSGVVSSSGKSVLVPSDLINGTTYKAYIKAWQPNVNGEEHTSIWTAGAAFTITLDAPAQPTIVATNDDVNARVGLVVQARDNMLTLNQSDIETNTAGWAAGANTTISRITSQFNHGAASLQLASVAAGTMSATTPTGAGGIPVVAGLQYTAIASFRRISATANRNCRVDVAWYTAGGALIQTDLGSSVADSNANWTQSFVTVVAPPTAAFATVVLTVLGATAAAEQHAADTIKLAPGNLTTWTVGGFAVAGTQLAIIERSIDGGVTWTTVRGLSAYQLPQPSQTSVTLYDYEATRGLAVQYRARVYVISGLSTIAGPNSATSAATVAPTDWRLKDPQDATRNITVRVQPGVKITFPKPLVVDYPIGQGTTAVSHDGVRMAVIAATLMTLTKVDYDALYLLLNSGRTLLLQDVLGRQWYVQPGDGVAFQMYRAVKLPAETTQVRHAHEADFTFIEVEAP
jgi:DNA-binding transcriptional regulator YdaS (Cro superfamily)